MKTWRLLDSGVRSAAENMALDEAILEARSRGLVPNTVRLLQFSPEAVLVGYHQSVEQEVRLSYCESEGIDVNRRITGGGAIFFDSTQLGWELIASKDDLGVSLATDALFESICQAVVRALGRFGLRAEFRPKNDIEIGGRKISGTGGTEVSGAFLFQGTLLVDFDVERMLRALKIPTEKLKDKEVDSVRERVTCLRWELGDTPSLEEIKSAVKGGFEEAFGVRLIGAGLTDTERSLFEQKLATFSSPDWIYKVRHDASEQEVLRAAHKADGGLIRISLAVNLKERSIRSILITGDFFAFPKRTIYDLEAALKNARADMEEVEWIIAGFFRGRKASIPGVTPLDFVKAVGAALSKMRYPDYGLSLGQANCIFTVVDSLERIAANGASLLLLPYCAKLPQCDLRYTKGCTSCGECTVGEAYTLGEEVGMVTESIVSFEDLRATLERYKAKGTLGFVGACCEAFYVKHRSDFEEIGLPGILVDIDNETCYDLGKEIEAYLGEFESKTELKIDVLRKVLEMVRRPVTV